MRYIVHCVDKIDSPLRDKFHTEHREYVDAQPLKVFTAGPLMDDAGEKMLGSMLIFDCESRQEIDNFLKDEPFNKAGLFAQVNVHRWDKHL